MPGPLLAPARQATPTSRVLPRRLPLRPPRAASRPPRRGRESARQASGCQEGSHARSHSGQEGREDDRRKGRLTISAALSRDEGERSRIRSLALKRRREKERRGQQTGPREKVLREVILPEAITIQDWPTAWPSAPLTSSAC